MSPSQLFEPTYATIKARLMQGVWAPGFQLEAARLASELNVSISPIRDSLNRLAGEAMIDATSGAGFRVPAINECGLLDLLDLNRLLLECAVFTARVTGPQFYDTGTDHATRTGQVFLHIAQRSGNGELVEAVAGLSDRLHVFRRHDAEILTDAERQIERIKVALHDQDALSDLAQGIKRYHDEAIMQAARFIHVRGGSL